METFVLICPTGKSLRLPDLPLSSPAGKNISLSASGKSLLQLPPSCPIEGRCATSSTRGGMRWTRAARRRTVLTRTAKSCGPDASTPASSLREAAQTTETRKPDLRGNHCVRECRVFRCDRGDDTRVLPTHCTRGCGCNGHPAFPTPSWANGSCTTRAHRAARANAYLNWGGKGSQALWP